MLIVKAGLGVPPPPRMTPLGWLGGVVWHTCPKGLLSVLVAGKEGVGQHGGSLSNKMQRSPDLLAEAVWKGCAWEAGHVLCGCCKRLEEGIWAPLHVLPCGFFFSLLF